MLACMLSGFSRVPLLVTVSTAEQSESVTHIHVDSPCCKAPCWTDLTTVRQVAFPVLHRKFSLVAYFICGVNGAYVSIPSSRFLPQPLLPRYPLPMHFFWWPTSACSHKRKGILGSKAPAQLNKRSARSQYPKVKKSQLSQSSCLRSFGFPSLSHQDNQKCSRNPGHFIMGYLIRCLLVACSSYLPKV